MGGARGLYPLLQTGMVGVSTEFNTKIPTQHLALVYKSLGQEANCYNTSLDRSRESSVGEINPVPSNAYIDFRERKCIWDSKRCPYFRGQVREVVYIRTCTNAIAYTYSCMYVSITVTIKYGSKICTYNQDTPK